MREKLPSKTMTIMLGTTGALIVMLIFMVGMVLAETPPEQQFNKIYMKPFYRESMNNDQNYTYTVSVGPYKGISDVVSAIVTFQVWQNPSVRYYLWVDGELCNTPSFYVSTTYANAGEGTIFFDCSNVINNAGNYTVVIQPDDDTGTVTAWVDLVYMNIPQGDLGVMGTEYEINDRGTIFLQLKDEQGLPVNNGSCVMDVYYPEQVNSSHASLLIDAPLLYLDGSDGIYYYDLNILNVTGVYMVSASCSYAFQNFWIYPAGSTNSVNVTRIIGSYTGSTIVLNSPTDYLYTFCSSSGGGTKECTSDYEWNLSYYGINQSAINSIGYHYLGETSTIGVGLTMYAYNWTSDAWYNLPNNMTFSGLAKSGFPTGINDYLGNTILEGVNDPHDFINSSGIVKLRLESTHGTNFDQYNNWIALSVMTQSGVITDVKGSGELHVTNHFANLTELINSSINNLTNLTAEEIWNFSSRNLTYFNYTPIFDYIDLLDANMANNFTEVLRRLDEINFTVNNTYTWIQGLDNYSVSDIWSFANRTLSDYNFTEILDYLYGINQTTQEIKAFQLNELSDNLTEMNIILGDINQTANDTLEWVQGLANTTAYDIWNYGSRNLTYTEDVTNYTLMQAYVWNNTDRNLTYFNYTPIYDDLYLMNASMASYYANILTAISNSNSSILDEIASTNQTLYGAIVDSNSSVISAIDSTNATLYNAIANSNSSIIALLNAHNGTIMTKLYLLQDEVASVNDSVNNLENLTASDVWSFNNRTLTGFNFTVEANLTAVLDAIAQTNQTLYQSIVDSNSSIIGRLDAHNNTIMMKLYSLQDDIVDMNTSIMWRFDGVDDDLTQIISDVADVQSTTDDIYNQTSEIWWLVWNLTIGNVSVNANVNWTEGIEEGSNISNPVVLQSQFVTYAAATSPGESVTKEYCLDNTTLISEMNTTKCLFGECFNMSTELPTTCTYGCYQDRCNPEPIDKFLIIMMFFLAVVAIIVAITLVYNKYG